MPADPILLAMMSVDLEPEERHASIDRLLNDHALPVIDAVIGRRCRTWGDLNNLRDEVRGEVIVRLLKRLRTMPDVSAIRSFRDYVAVVTSHVADDMMRRYFPRRAQLKNRIRYLIRHDPRFLTWTAEDGEVFCRLAEGPAMPECAGRWSEGLAQEITGVLQGSPACELNRIVTAVASSMGIREGADTPPHDSPKSHGEDAAARVESINYLRRLWLEIEVLPPRQRAALLLNLRDPTADSALLLLPLLGVATVRRIASVLAMDAGRLAELWPRLPLADDEIAGMLSTTRQQVINLRKSARARLTRRMTRLK